MSTLRSTANDPRWSMHGVEDLDDQRIIGDEANLLGAPVAAQTGAVANIIAGAPAGQMRVSGLTGMATTDSLYRVIFTSGAADANNNGGFIIVAVNSASEVDVLQPNASTIPDVNNGAITWTEYESYVIADNIDYAVTNIRLIKGTANHSDAIPTYQRPTAIGTNVDANLTNIAGKTLDAVAWICTEKFENATMGQGAGSDTTITTVIQANLVDAETFALADAEGTSVTFEFDTVPNGVGGGNVLVDVSGATTADDVRDIIITAVNNQKTLGNLFINASIGGAGVVDLDQAVPGTAGDTVPTETVADAGFLIPAFTGGSNGATTTVTDAGNLPHADAVDRTGVPIFDGADAGDDEATYVELINPTTGVAMEVLEGSNAGNRIYARATAGGGTEPNDVELVFRSVAPGAPLSASIAYIYEAGLPATVDVYVPKRNRLDQKDENWSRVTLVHGIVGDAGIQADITNILNQIGTNPTDTSLAGLLTNTTPNFPFGQPGNLDVDPTVVEALNVLNAEMGDMTFTGSILTTAATVAANLQALADAIASASVTRTIERISANKPKFVTFTLPGGISYTPDGGNNGINLWFFYDGEIQWPGAIDGTNTYSEIAGAPSTQLQPYFIMKAGRNADYFALA